jgi:hypothetical protein
MALQNLSGHPECISTSPLIDYVQRLGIPKQVRNDHIRGFVKSRQSNTRHYSDEVLSIRPDTI